MMCNYVYLFVVKESSQLKRVLVASKVKYRNLSLKYMKGPSELSFLCPIQWQFQNQYFLYITCVSSKTKPQREVTFEILNKLFTIDCFIFMLNSKDLLVFFLDWLSWMENYMHKLNMNEWTWKRCNKTGILQSIFQSNKRRRIYAYILTLIRIKAYIYVCNILVSITETWNTYSIYRNDKVALNWK